MRSLLPAFRLAASSARGRSLRPITSITLSFLSSSTFTYRPLPTTVGFAIDSRPISSCTHHQAPNRGRAAASSSPELEGQPPPSPLFSEPPTLYSFFPQTLPSGPPPSGPFGVDLRALKREFLSLQARAHPDLASPSDKKQAEALSAQINEAYKILSSPLLRAQYLLAIHGQDKGIGEEGKTDDVELLTEVVETHHDIEEAETEEELEGIKTENEGRIEESVRRLDKFFHDDDMAGARQEAVKLKYWVAIREKIHEWEVQKGKSYGEQD